MILALKKPAIFPHPKITEITVALFLANQLFTILPAVTWLERGQIRAEKAPPRNKRGTLCATA